MADVLCSDENGARDASEEASARASDLASRALETLNSGLIVTQPEPSQRSKSYRELILQEMNWMASDYYHERRWKKHVARQVCIGINESIMERKRMNKNWIANECSINMKRFWAGVTERHVDSSVISSELLEYCNSVGMNYRHHLQVEIGGLTDDYYIGEKDLIAISVPGPAKLDATTAANTQGMVTAPKAPIQKSDVLDTAVLIMQSMGAEFYHPIFRPPDDDMDMFTMPLMDPIRDEDFNALLIQHFFLKNSDHIMALSQGKQVDDCPMIPVISRKFNRHGNVPSCLAVSVRDFDLQAKPKPAFKGAMIKTTLSSIDFELLDAWMFSESPSWPLLATCISYRSGSSGLYRYEYSSKYCKYVYENLRKQPRGLVNSSRRLLGPRQRNAITTFLESPLPKHKYRPVASYREVNITSESLNALQQAGNVINSLAMNKTGSESSDIEDATSTTNDTLERSIIAFKLHITSFQESQQKGAVSEQNEADNCIVHMMEQDVKDSKEDAFEDTQNDVEFSKAGMDPNGDLEIQLPFLDSLCTSIGKLPVTLLQRKENSNLIGIIKQTLSLQRSVVLEKVPAENAKGELIALPENALVEVDMFSKKRLRQAYRSDNDTDPSFQIPNMSYGEYSNRMSKQLRVGFLGIPAKMFAHSLFYSGRFCKNSRVRRVAVTISNATKVIMPQPNLLYGRLFEHDLIGIFGKYRNPNWQKPVEYVPDQHAEQLVKKYTGDVLLHSPSKKVKSNISLDVQVADMLASYVGIRLSRGEMRPQGSITHDKISTKNIEQVLHTMQPPQMVTEQPKSQPMHSSLPSTAGDTVAAQQPLWSGHSASSSMQHSQMDQQCGSLGQLSMTSSPMQIRHLHVPTAQQQSQMTHSHMAATPMPHGQATPGCMTPGQMSHIPLTPGSMTPNHLAQMKMPPSSMPQVQVAQSQFAPVNVQGSQPPQIYQQMHGPPQNMQLQMHMHMHMDQMEQLKRRHAMDISSSRRTIIPYEQMYHSQMPMPQYTYRPIPDSSMMPMPLYPMPMYKKVPYPKSHDEQCRQQHMPR